MGIWLIEPFIDQAWNLISLQIETVVLGECEEKRRWSFVCNYKGKGVVYVYFLHIVICGVWLRCEQHFGD